MAIKKGYWNSDALANPAMRSRDDSYSNIKLSAGESWDIDSAMTNLEMNQQGNVDIHTLGVSVPTADKIIIKSNTIPAASADLLGAVYQYVGQTDGTYQHGYIYECKAIPADTLVFTPDTVSCDWANLSAFLQTETADYNSVVAGTMTYVENAELWRLVFKDTNGNTVLTYQQYTPDWESVGFVFSGTFEDGDVVSFVRNTTATYLWKRIDVQPNSEAEIAELQAEVDEIQSVIPAQASASNKLADKNFVNSSIATNTATFRGTYNTLAELEAQPADNNDYGFVVSTDAAGNTVYNRYKYDGTAWVFEYALNNSSFTANQWEAINSNATSAKIAQIDTNKTNLADHIADTNNPHQVTKAQVGLGNVDNTSDLAKPVSTATQAALDEKEDVLTPENAGNDISISGGSGTFVIKDTNFVEFYGDQLDYVKVFGGTGQNGTPTPSVPADIISNNGALKARHQSGLPLGYTLLDYIQSSGSQYIDTLRVPNNNDIIEQKFQKVGGSDATCSWYGSMPSSQTITPRIGIGSFSQASVPTLFAGSNYTGVVGTANTNVHTLRFQVTGEKELTYTFDGVTNVIAAPSINMYKPAVELTSYLFARHGTNGVQAYDNEGTKIYYHREYLANGTLVLNMVPVKRNSDNVLGMYDFVSGQFFTNQGTGTFTAGDPVSDPVEIYTDGTVETIAIKDDQDATVSTATCEDLLSVGTYTDEQEIISGVVTRKVGVKVLDGTEEIFSLSDSTVETGTKVFAYTYENLGMTDILDNAQPMVDIPYPIFLNTHFTKRTSSAISDFRALKNGEWSANGVTSTYTNRYLILASNQYTTEAAFKQWLADQYAAGTPVIVVYPLATETTESVAGQTLQLTSGSNTLEITQAGLNNLELEAEYTSSGPKKISFVNNDGFVKATELATVATSGSYDDLTNKPTLGTAASADITDFATVAQGAKADTAVQPTVMQAALDTKAPLDTFLAPNFDGLTPIATYEFDTSSTSFYKLLTFNNIYATTEAIPVARALFRITATISGKTSVINAIVETQKALTYMRILSNHTTGYTASSNTGIRYMRSSCPKALNDGNDWELDVSTYNATARHIKVEVFQSDNGFTWFANGSVSTITTNTHSSSNITYYQTQGTITHPSLNMSVTSATTATYISGRLPKLLAGTMPLAGEALLANQFCFMSNSLVYPATENTVPINTGFGLAVSYGAVASGGGTSYPNILQKYAVSSLSNIPHDTLDRGAPCFFRCTMDANGNIFSDNYVATEMTAGYTWYYVGVASTASAIMVDTTSSVFLTLDANGNLTHVNGKRLAGGGSGGAVDSVNGKTGVVVLDASDVGAATAAQGALADTALQPGDNVSELVNDAGYLVMGDLTGFVTRTTAQTISGLKTFTADIVLSGTTSIKNTTSGVSYTMLYRDTSGIHVGTSTQALLLAGSGTRPTFNGNNVAMSADIPTVNNPTITFTQGGVTMGSITLNQATGDTIALDAGGSGSAQSVGNVFWTMRTDNELNGAVECNGATYDTTDFTGAQSIGQLLAGGKVPYVSLAQYATLLSTQGSCGVFGWDGVGTTAFRVPSLNDIFVETGTAAQIGDYLPAGAPNITGDVGAFQMTSVADKCTGAFTYKNFGTSSYGGGGSQEGARGANLDASRSSSVYGNSNTIQPNTVRYRAMVQLATGATDEALETCTGVLADVASLKYDYVTEFQEPTAQNNYTWYRKYKSGWVEQGGYSASTGSWGTKTITLPVEMRDAYYTLTIGADGTSADFTNSATGTVRGGSRSNVTARTTTSFQCQSNNIVTWQVSGVAAN